MPYCSKCGKELAEDSNFCPSCGTSVAKNKKRENGRPMGTLAIILIAVIAVAVFAVIASLPLRMLESNRGHSVPYHAGLNTLNLSLTADVAKVNIAFVENLMGSGGRLAISLNASGTARAGIVAPDIFGQQWFRSNDTIEGDVLIVTSQIDIADHGWPRIASLNVTCDISIDPSIITSLNVKTAIGGVTLETQAGVVFDSLNLEAITGGVEANLEEDVVISRDISFKTTTGGVKLDWENVDIMKSVEVNAVTATGGVSVDVHQHEELLGNVTLNAEATTGGVDLTMELQGGVGAKIESSVTTGGIDVDTQVGFSGTESLLLSDNYLAGSNFYVTLKTVTGGVEINAEYTP